VTKVKVVITTAAVASMVVVVVATTIILMNENKEIRDEMNKGTSGNKIFIDSHQVGM